MATKGKHHEVTLKAKYEALKELEKGRPNKDGANQFYTPSSTSTTWKKKTKKKSLTIFKIHDLNKKRENWNIQKVKESLTEVVYINV